MNPALAKLESIIRIELDNFDLECDPHSYVVSNLLRKANITHTRLSGYVVEAKSKSMITPHVWIVLGEKSSGLIIDHQLTRWLGSDGESDSSVPDGIFCESAYPGIKYTAMNILNSDEDIEVLDGLTDDLYSTLDLPSYLVREIKQELGL